MIAVHTREKSLDIKKKKKITGPTDPWMGISTGLQDILLVMDK